MRKLAGSLALSVWLVALPARAVDLAIVLLTDVSRSMDEEEYAMVKAGYREAFRDPEVIAALTAHPEGVALAYVEFSGRGEVFLVEGFREVTDAGSATAFGDAVAGALRTAAGSTDVPSALDAATTMLLAEEFDTARRVIDIASDETGDGGRMRRIRDRAVAAGITINAIPLTSEARIATDLVLGRITTARTGAGTVADFYRREVIGGPGAFVMEARQHSAFGEALKRKLLLELLADATPERPEPAL